MNVRQTRVALGALLVLVLACGPQENPKPRPSGPTTASSDASLPRPKQNIAQTARKLAAASEDKSCATLDPLIHPHLRPPSSEDKKEQCLNYLSLMKGFQVIATRSHGTGAVIDYSYFAQGDKRAIYTMLLALDKDGLYKLFQVEGAHEAAVALTPPTDQGMGDEVAQAAVGAIREGNCDKLFAIAHETLAPGANDKVEFCDQYLGSGFQKALQADAAAVPQSLGGDSQYLFYSLQVKPDRYYTLAVGRVRGAYRFITEVRLL